MHSSNVTWITVCHKRRASLLCFLLLLISDEDYVIKEENESQVLHVMSNLHFLHIVTVTNKRQIFVPKSKTTLKQWAK